MGIRGVLMLGKTAAHIFWIFRYLERCENTARLINASHFISLTQKQNIANHWDSILNVAGNKKAFLSKYGAINKSAVINFILRDKTNPSSVLSSIENARQNARIVRNNLTTELFETIKFINKKAFIPLINKEIPIIGDSYVDMEFGTGCLKITPGHDFNDF